MDLLGAACWGAPLIIVPPKGKILSRFWTGAVGLTERAPNTAGHFRCSLSAKKLSL